MTNYGVMTTDTRMTVCDDANSTTETSTLVSDALTGADGHCNFATTLMINRFNHSDNGYYWCQIVSNSSCLLRPSPRGYVVVGAIMTDQSCNFGHQLATPICAEDATLLEEMGCISLSSATVIMPTPIVNYSVQIYNSMTTLDDNKEFTREDNMIWLYGLMTAFLLVIIVLVLTLTIVSVKCRTLQKRSKLNVYRYAVCIMHACTHILV